MNQKVVGFVTKSYKKLGPSFVILLSFNFYFCLPDCRQPVLVAMPSCFMCLTVTQLDDHSLPLIFPGDCRAGRQKQLFKNLLF